MGKRKLDHVDREYAPRATATQKEMMLEFIEKHPETINNQLTRNFTNDERKRLWTELASILNADGLGAKKDASGWTDTWGEYKSYSKKRAAAIKNGIKRTGGGRADENPLFALDERIASLMGKSSINGVEVNCVGFEALQDMLPSESVQVVNNLEIPSTSRVTNLDIPSTSQVNNLDMPSTSREQPENCSLPQSPMPESVLLKDVMATIFSCSEENGPVTTETPSQVFTPDRGPRNKKRKNILPRVELERTKAAAESLAAVQQRSAIAMENLADTVHLLGEIEKEKLEVQKQLEERRLRLMEENNEIQAQQVAVFKEALSAFLMFLKK